MKTRRSFFVTILAALGIALSPKALNRRGVTITYRSGPDFLDANYRKGTPFSYAKSLPRRSA